LEETIANLERWGVPLRIDPIVEPIGCGFAASLARYVEIRRRYPQSNLLMGIGNITELTDSDSAGLNTLLLGFCEELSITSVLTTQVIHWAQSSVRECDLARKMVHYAVKQGIPAKHLEPRLIPLRGIQAPRHPPAELEELAEAIRDPNFRIFLTDNEIHILSAGLHLRGTDPYALREQILAANPRNLDASHAIYLGYELAKARIALTLGKAYVQDEALDWGFLTIAESKRHGP
jgi:dihydropteroate synthase